MKLPRDLSGSVLAKALGRVGYRVVRQSGSHVRLTHDGLEQHHVTVPAHDPLKIGTLAAILTDVAAHLKIDRDELATRLFD
ncbi:MAG: type II toxin-antitoxin system HicA family toxin [Reyranella sp.]|nr:type II toxin-antitoxin system HicA family toxin [Reyranella sp.]MDP3159389.1 type II toxin-antitoxin system HicA family toxin [Reyranella sp.]